MGVLIHDSQFRSAFIANQCYQADSNDPGEDLAGPWKPPNDQSATRNDCQIHRWI